MNKKKLVALFSAMLIVAILFSGCSSPAASTTAPASTEASASTTAPEATAAPTEQPVAAKEYTIGFLFYGNTDALGSDVYALVNEAASTLGVTINWQLGALDPDTQIQQVQNLISAGVDGIVLIPLSDTVAQKAAEAAEKANIKFAFTFRNISDPAIKAEIMGMKNFVGMTSEDETGAGAQLVKYLTDAGRKNLGVGYCPPGGATFINRNTGIDQGIADNGATKLAEFTLNPADTNSSGASVQNMMTAYPEMDGVVLCAGSNGIGESVVTALDASKKDISLATFDTFGGMDAAFSAGTLTAVSGGMAPDGLYTFMLVYNALNGTPLSDKPIELAQPYIFVTNAEDLTMFSTYLGDPTKIVEVFNSDYIKSLSKANNPALDAATLQKTMSEYSIAWVKTQLK